MPPPLDEEPELDELDDDELEDPELEDEDDELAAFGEPSSRVAASPPATSMPPSSLDEPATNSAPPHAKLAPRTAVKNKIVFRKMGPHR